jgi:hypothetical protein
MGIRCGFGSLAAVCAFALAAMSSAGATTLDDLKGYSIEVNVSLRFVWRTTEPRATVLNVHRRLYISQSGRIFDYADRAGGSFGEHEGDVVAPGAAASIGRNRMIAWTFENGSLVGISREVEGFTVRTVTVDPSRSSCTFVTILQPDPTTRRTVLTRLDGKQDEAVSQDTLSSVCTIRKGNIFATDQ